MMELFRKLFKASDGWCPNSGKPAPVKEAAQRNSAGHLLGMNCLCSKCGRHPSVSSLGIFRRHKKKPKGADLLTARWLQNHYRYRRPGSQRQILTNELIE